jgi:predicted Zn-dependent protease with MMP-like domain
MPAAREIHEAARLLAAGHAAAAAQRLSALLAGGALSPADEANARYLSASAIGAMGDHDGMIREWQHVLRLDAAAPRLARLMSEDEVESVAAAALDELPQDLLDELQGVGIMVVDRPSPEMVADGLDPRLLGLYHGVPLSRRSVAFGAPYADTIHLFSANLERVCRTRAELARQIRVTVLHETAHFFGYSEAQLRSMGLA